jgi:phosphoserine phosphatase RsbU/P
MSNELLVPPTPLSPELVAVLRQKVPLLPALQPIDSVHAEQLTLALSEHLTNIWQHNSTQCRISIEFERATKTLIVCDNGQNICEKLQRSKTSELPAALAESGRGLWLIWQCFPELKYRYDATINYLYLPLVVAKVHLVLIDDDPVQLAVLKARLDREYRVTSFTDPQVALTFLLANSADLIICDIRMPVLDGLSLRQRLLADDEAQHIPFLFLSGSDDDDLKEKAVMLSIDDYMTKLIQEPALKQNIRRILTRSRHVKASINAKLEQALTNSLWSELPPTWQHWQLSVAYRVATKGGGDFVFSQQRHQSILLLLGDVMGHGVQAKFFSFALSGYLRGLCLAVTDKQSPALLLSQLSSAIHQDTVLQKTLLTALVLEIFKDGRVVISCAGHPPPFLYNSNKQWSEVATGGVLLGLIPEACYNELTLDLSSGETLIAFTDGFTEQYPRLSDNFTAPESLFSVLTSSDDPISLAEFLTQNTTEQLSDDVTLLSIKRQ